MKHSVKFASHRESEEYFPLEADAAAPGPADTASAPRPLRVVEPVETDLPPASDRDAALAIDLAAELEAALMQDLHSVADLLNQPAEAEAFPVDPLAPRRTEEDDSDLDFAALERLLATVRQPVPNPQPPQPEQPQRLARSAFEPSEPVEPAGGAQTSAAEQARRLRPRAPLTPVPAPAGRRIQSSLIVGAALIALAGGGAFVTVQTVTAQDEEPVASVAAAPAIAPEALPVVDKVEDRAPVETASAETAAAPIRVIAAPSPSAPAESWSLPEPAVRSTLGETLPSEALAPEAAAAPPADAEAAVPAETVAVAAVDPAPPRSGSGSSDLSPGAARITSSVKLRGNPDNGAPVVGLLGAGTSVTIVGCKGWCEVVAGDKRGFVFKKFLAQSGGG